MNIALLTRIRESGGYTPLDLLRLEWPETERELAELESFGFQFSRHPYLGIAYAGPAARLCPDQIEYELGTRWVGQRIAVWDRVSSTNDLAARAARSQANGGLVILAESQTAGRGRRGRSWSAPAESAILASVLVFPPGPIADVSWLTALGAVAVAEAVEAELGMTLQIKWPNDSHYGEAVSRNSNLALNLGWRNRLEPLGRMVRLQLTTEVLEGRLLDADLELGVAVLDASGVTHRLGHDKILAFEETSSAPLEEIEDPT